MALGRSFDGGFDMNLFHIGLYRRRQLPAAFLLFLSLFLLTLAENIVTQHDPVMSTYKYVEWSSTAESFEHDSLRLVLLLFVFFFDYFCRFFPTDTSVNRCEVYSGSMCKDMIGKSVFIPAGYTQAAMESSFKMLVLLIRVAPQSSHCDRDMTAFACANVFHPCQDTYGTPMFSQPSRALCNQYKESCDEFFEGENSVVKDLDVSSLPGAEFLRPTCDAVCSSPQPTICVPGQDMYPVSATVYSTDPLITMPANSYSSDAEPTVAASMVTYVPAPCPAPLVNPTSAKADRILDGACALPCPLIMWTTEEYELTDTISDIVSSISLVLAIFLSVTWIVFPQQRQKRYILYFILCLTVMNIVYWIGLRIRGNVSTAASFCEDNANEYHMKGFCLFQSMVMLYSILAGIAWWMLQAVDLFLKVYLQKRFPKGSKEESMKEYIFHSIAWGVPLLSLIAGLASEQLGGYAIGTNWCLFSQGRVPKHSQDMSWPFYYYPIFIMCLVGTVSMILITISLCQANHNAARRATVTHRGGAHKINFSAFLRMFLFVLLMAIVWIFLLSYKLHTWVKRPEWAESTKEFVTCLLFEQPISAIFNPANPIDCGMHPKNRLSYSMLVALVVITCIPSILIFLLHGTSYDIYRAWAGFFYDRLGIKIFAKYSGKRLEIYNMSQTTTASAHRNQATHASATGNAAGATVVSTNASSAADKNKRNLFAKSSTSWRQPGAPLPALQMSIYSDGPVSPNSPTSQVTLNTGAGVGGVPHSSSMSVPSTPYASEDPRNGSMSQPGTPTLAYAQPCDVAVVDLTMTAAADHNALDSQRDAGNTTPTTPTPLLSGAIPAPLPPHMRRSISHAPNSASAAPPGPRASVSQGRRYTAATPAPIPGSNGPPGPMQHPRARKSTQHQQHPSTDSATPTPGPVLQTRPVQRTYSAGGAASPSPLTPTPLATRNSSGGSPVPGTVPARPSAPLPLPPTAPLPPPPTSHMPSIAPQHSVQPMRAPAHSLPVVHDQNVPPPPPPADDDDPVHHLGAPPAPPQRR